MKSNNFISTINWRQIFIHLIASWMFMKSFTVLSFLHDTKSDEMLTSDWQKNHFNSERFISNIYWIYTSKYLGVLCAFIISIFISIKRKWFWLNSVIVFIMSYCLARFDLDGWQYVKQIFYFPATLFSRNSILYFLFAGLPMLTIGIVLFFSKRVIAFIENHYSSKATH